jgi:hypothetical protein
VAEEPKNGKGRRGVERISMEVMHSKHPLLLLPLLFVSLQIGQMLILQRESSPRLAPALHLPNAGFLRRLQKQ